MRAALRARMVLLVVLLSALALALPADHDAADPGHEDNPHGN